MESAFSANFITPRAVGRLSRPGCFSRPLSLTHSHFFTRVRSCKKQTVSSGDLEVSEEKRRFSRVPFRVTTEMTAKDVSYSADELTDLSVGGCLLPIETDLPPGTECHLKILLTGTTEELSVHIDGEVIRCTPEAVAIKFVRIDPDSLYHLQNIVRHNAPDPDEVDREIRKHPGLV